MSHVSDCSGGITAEAHDDAKVRTVNRNKKRMSFRRHGWDDRHVVRDSDLDIPTTLLKVGTQVSALRDREAAFDSKSGA
jgi:hypothetical protein